MITIVKQGLSDTIQDLGRFGYQKFGVVTSGAMDAHSHRIANLLVGNAETDSTIETTLVGPHIAFEEEAIIAICGGDLQPTIDGVAVDMWKPVFIQKNDVLTFGGARSGSRAYLAVAGGFRVASMMNSQSTYLKASIGGFKGRTLQKGDTIYFNERSTLAEALFKALSQGKRQMSGWRPSSILLPTLTNDYEIRFMKGRQYHLFNEESKHCFVNEKFTVSSQSDRMGYRLKGAALLQLTPSELISEAVSFGSVQVPPDGNPIILAADCQTTGGYPKIGQIAAVDLSLIAQAKPGNQFSFREISLETAQSIVIRREKSLRNLKLGIVLKLKGVRK